ncbi:hypothetical protein ACMFMG_007865 [Clarireedia jacksonii]
MAPLSTEIENPQYTWTPDVIATIVYRAIMVVVSLIYIWRKTYYSPRSVDGMEQLKLLHLQLLAAHTSTSQPTTYEPINSSATTSVLKTITHEATDSSTTTSASKSTTASKIITSVAQGLECIVSTALNSGNDDGLSLTFNTNSYSGSTSQREQEVEK